MPMLVSIARCIDVVPGMTPHTVLHCGPALEWPDMCDPLRRSIRATVIAEAWAGADGDVSELIASGSVRLAPANTHDTVLPMATAIGPTAPVLVVDDDASSTRAFSAVNQGSGRAVVRRRFAGCDRATDHHMTPSRRSSPRLWSCPAPSTCSRWQRRACRWATRCMRSQATTNLLWRTLLPHLLGVESGRRIEAARFLSGNHLFFLNVAMARAKAVLMSAYDVPGSSIVVGMSRNGTTFGIRLAGTGEKEFLTRAQGGQRALPPRVQRGDGRVGYRR